MNKKLGIGIVVVAIVALSMFAGCVETGTPEFEITDLSVDSPVTHMGRTEMIYGVLVTVNGKLLNTGSATAHDVYISYSTGYPASPTYSIISASGNIGNVKPGDAVTLELAGYCSVFDLKFAKENNMDLTETVEIMCKEGSWEKTGDAEWLKELCEHWSFEDDY